jgi:hypothetical protein
MALDQRIAAEAAVLAREARLIAESLTRFRSSFARIHSDVSRAVGGSSQSVDIDMLRSFTEAQATLDQSISALHDASRSASRLGRVASESRP